MSVLLIAKRVVVRFALLFERAVSCVILFFQRSETHLQLAQVWRDDILKEVQECLKFILGHDSFSPSYGSATRGGNARVSVIKHQVQLFRPDLFPEAQRNWRR